VYTAGCQGGCTTRFDNRLNEQWLFIQHACQTCLTTGWMFVYTIQPVVKPVVSCKRGITISVVDCSMLETDKRIAHGSRDAVSWSECCQQRWSLSVINLRRSTKPTNTRDGRRAVAKKQKNRLRSVFGTRFQRENPLLFEIVECPYNTVQNSLCRLDAYHTSTHGMALVRI